MNTIQTFIALFVTGLVSVGAETLVQKWHPIDIRFESPVKYENPFRDVELSATFSGPGGETFTIPGFYSGDNAWTVRFAPTRTGVWNYVSESSDPHLREKKGSVKCIENSDTNVHGGLRVDEVAKRHFKYDDGTCFFLLGCEINWLAFIDMQDPNLAKTKEIIEAYADNGFNMVLLNAYANDTTWKKGRTEAQDWGPPALHPWKGTPSNFDYSHLNTAYWDHFDRVMDYLRENGMVAYLYFKVYNKLVDWPEKGSIEDELYFSYIVSRYQAYPNVVWSFSKESYYEPDHDYISKMLRLIDSKDAYQRLITTHDDNGQGIDFAFDGDYGDVLDFYTDQTQHDIYNNSFEDYSRKEWPITNMEPGYQGGNDGTNTYGGPVRNSSPEGLLKRIYNVYMAGAYAAYYYTWHAWDVVRTDETPKNLVYYKYLSDFFNETKWYELAPSDELVTGSGNHCLSKAGEEYIVYLGNGGSTTLTVESTENRFRGTWMNTLTGEKIEQEVALLDSNEYVSPWNDAPSVLWIRKR